MGVSIDKAGKKHVALQMHLLLRIIVAAALLGIKTGTQSDVLRKNIDNLPFVYDNGQLLQNGATRYHGNNPSRVNRQVHGVLLPMNHELEVLPSFQLILSQKAVGLELCVARNRAV